VRGTSRNHAGLARIESAGLEPAEADPDRPGTILELAADVTVVHWLLGSADREPEAIAAIHGPRLERLLEKLVDSPVRGFVYEAAGSVPRDRLEQGAAIVDAAAARWRIPVRVVNADPGRFEPWLAAMLEATLSLTGAAGSASAAGWGK